MDIWDVLLIVGAAAVIAGAAWLSVQAGIITGGLVLVLTGFMGGRHG